MINRILSGWNLVRILRLVLGIIIIVQGISTKEWTFVMLGSLLTLMPLLNIGCCGPSGCNVPATQSRRQTKDISYEEVR